MSGPLLLYYILLFVERQFYRVANTTTGAIKEESSQLY